MRSGPGEARTILLLHIISVRPSKQPLMVRTFLKVYMELGSYFLFLQEQIKDIIALSIAELRHWERRDPSKKHSRSRPRARHIPAGTTQHLTARKRQYSATCDNMITFQTSEAPAHSIVAPETK